MNKVTIKNECTCTILDDNGEEQPVTDCYGECWEDGIRFLDDCVLAYFNAKATTQHHVVFKGTGMGWLRETGYAIHENSRLTSEMFIKYLELNGDFTLDVELSDDADVIYVKRYSHDEPTGASFLIVHEIAEDEDEDED